MEYTNLPGTTLTLRLAVKSDNSSPAILFRDSEKLDATIKLSLTLPTGWVSHIRPGVSCPSEYELHPVALYPGHLSRGLQTSNCRRKPTRVE